MKYLDQSNLARDTDFLARIKTAGFVAAITVTNESSNVPNHQRRLAFAQTYAHHADTYLSNLAFALAADLSITALASDSQLQARMDAIWDTFAGKSE